MIANLLYHFLLEITKLNRGLNAQLTCALRANLTKNAGYPILKIEIQSSLTEQASIEKSSLRHNLISARLQVNP
jgi:hypothetical protein